MQILGRYTLSANTRNDLDSAAMVSEIETSIADWLQPKGTITSEGPPIVITLNDGRQAELHVSKLGVDPNILMTWRLREPIEQGSFQTTIELATNQSRISLDVRMEAGTEGVLMPLRVDARCPVVVRRLLRTGWDWEVGGWVLPDSELQYRGAEGGREFIELLKDPNRSLPLVAISEDGSWPDDFLEALRADVAGVSLVVTLDDAAAWEVTDNYGRYWSCYNGALRIYWPKWQALQEPLDHPLWTKERISGLRPTNELAYRAVRNSVRRRLLRLSTLGMQRDSLFGEVIDAYRKYQKSQAKDSDDLLDIYIQENDYQSTRIDQLEDENARLRIELDNSEAMRAWQEADEAGEVEPDSLDNQPETVEDALYIASERFGDQLLFGDLVNSAAADLAPDAGPPAKILRFLEGLNDLSMALQAGPLGKDVIEWLKERGFNASGESQTVKNQGGRTWPVDNVPEQFEQHLKPNDGTSSDRCVRIYFKWDEMRSKVLVGWVGRHPD